MVKFGGHVEALREGDLADSELYLIPYNNMKLMIEHKESGEANLPMQIQENAEIIDPKVFNSIDFVFDGAERKQADDEHLREEEFFSAIWKKALKDAEDDFHKVRGKIWETVFSGIAANDDAADPLVRGAHPGNAIKLYVELSRRRGGTDAQDLLARMNQIYQAASTNSEALRKLVKKSDKHRGERQLSSKLLPLLYTSSLYSGQNMIQDSIDLLRDLISGDFVDSDSDGDNDLFDRQFKKLVRHDSETRHQESVDVRMMEFNWLKSLVQSIPSKELLPKLVAHRGFHNIKDRNDKRPVENSLSAYEMAWSCGIELCECDIALTKDEKLVLAHDENFARLSLDAQSANSKRKVSDLTLKELISMPLTNGVRPPLLIDVLRSASAISERSKLIIEIKPGNEASAFALSRLLIRHPDLRSSVAMIMSFDASTMHRLREELDRAIVPDSRDYTGGDTGMPLHSHRRVTSYDHFGTMSNGWLAGLGEGGGPNSPKLSGIKGSMNFSSIGLSINQSNLNQTPSTNTLKVEQQLEDNKGLTLSQSFASQSREAHNMPKLMLLTVADPPVIACELQVHYNELYRVDHWLSHDDGVLDGVYLQYEKEMMTPEGAACLRQLSKRTMVGIWNFAERDPDNFETFEWLVKEGNCSFVNTDLPKYFCMGVFTQKGRPPLPKK